MEHAHPCVEGHAQRIVQLLRQCRFDLSTEKHLQEGMQRAFEQAGLPFVREAVLAAGDIPDFLLYDCIVVECKIRGKSRKIDVYRQLERYAKHERVQCLVLAANFTMGLPPSLQGKPLYFASLSQAWL